MKKILLLAGLLFLGVSLYAQNAPDPQQPVLAAGELLYKGNTDFAEAKKINYVAQADKFEVSFVLSADKKEIRDLTVALTVSFIMSTITSPGTVYQTTAYPGPYPVQESQAHIPLGQNGELSIVFDKTGALGTVDYTYILPEHSNIRPHWGKSAILFQIQ